MQNSVLSSLNMGCTHLKVTLKKGKHEYSQKNNRRTLTEKNQDFGCHKSD